MSISNRGRVVYTTGVFDLMHYGHINLLNRARSYGDYLIVGLVDDEAVKRHKGSDRPRLPYKERERLLLSLRAVDEVVWQADFSPEFDFKVDVVVKGEDQDHIGEECAIRNNIPIVRLERTTGISTTAMIGGGC